MTETEIANLAFQLLGVQRIADIDGTSKAEKEAKAVFAIKRRQLLASYPWSFAVMRTSLTVDATPPDYEWGYRYQLPADFLRLVQWGADADQPLRRHTINATPVRTYAIEKGWFLTNDDSGVNLTYVGDEEDTELFPPGFTGVLAADIALNLCQIMVGGNSPSIVQVVTLHRTASMQIARATEIIQRPPVVRADSSWITARWE